MKRIILLTCAVAAVMISTAVRSQNAGAPIEPLVKKLTPTAISAPAAIMDPAAPVPPVVTDAASAKNPAAAPVTLVAASDDLPVGLTETADGLISVRFENLPMSEVIKLFSQLSGANIIAATTNLSGTVSVNLKNVGWKPAFESILGRCELLLIEKPAGSGIYIVESGVAGQEPRVTETIQLRYAKVDKMAELINTMLEKSGTATPFSDGNAILVQAPSSRLPEVKRIVETLDKPRGQVYIETRFVELSAAASKKVGVKWETFMDKDDKDLINYTVVPGNYARASTMENSADNGVANPINLAKFFNNWGALTSTQFKWVINAFEGVDGVSLISNPKIIVANEETAVVDMTTKFPYVDVKSQTTTSDAVVDKTITTQLQVIPGKEGTGFSAGEAFFSYGVLLKVTPRVSSSGVITVKIEPSISQLDLTQSKYPEGYYTVGTAGAQTLYPIVTIKKVTTMFSMLDGTTAVIGGFTTSKENKGDSNC